MTSASAWLEYSVLSRMITSSMTLLFLTFYLTSSTRSQSSPSTILFMCLAKYASEVFFCHDVRRVIFNTNILDINILVLHHVPQKMITNINMFCTNTCLSVSCSKLFTLIILINNRRLLHFGQIFQKYTYKLYLLCACWQCGVLCLCDDLSDGPLDFD